MEQQSILKTVLLSRVQALMHQIEHAEAAVTRGLDPKLWGRVRGRFEPLFKECRKALIPMQEDIKGARSARDLGCLWTELRKLDQHQCVPLFRESLALMHGSLVRTSGKDSGLCNLADALLQDLDQRGDFKWGRFTVLADKECIEAQDMPEIIRLRFPDASVWSLPIAAHELGHFVGQNLTDNINGQHYHPFQELLDRECKGENEKQIFNHLDEYFADFFATYTMGPSYACTCIMLRFDPYTAYKDFETHPCSAKRVHWILSILDRLDEEEPDDSSYGGIRDHLNEYWEQSVGLAGTSESIESHFGEGGIEQLEGWLDELYLCARRSFEGVRLKSGDWKRAQRMSRQLIAGLPANLDSECTLVDAVNAAWLCRLQDGGRDGSLVYRIGGRAMEICNLLKDRRYPG